MLLFPVLVAKAANTSSEGVPNNFPFCDRKRTLFRSRPLLLLPRVAYTLMAGRLSHKVCLEPLPPLPQELVPGEISAHRGLCSAWSSKKDFGKAPSSIIFGIVCPAGTVGAVL